MMQSPNDYVFLFLEPVQPYNHDTNKKNRLANLDLRPPARETIWGNFYSDLLFSFQVEFTEMTQVYYKQFQKPPLSLEPINWVVTQGFSAVVGISDTWIQNDLWQLAVLTQKVFIRDVAYQILGGYGTQGDKKKLFVGQAVPSRNHHHQDLRVYQHKFSCNIGMICA